MNERAQHEKLTFESWWVLSWGYRQNNSPTKNQTCWTQECQCQDAWGFCVTHRSSFVRYHRDEIEEAFSFSAILRAFGVLNPRSLPDTIGELPDCGKDILTEAKCYAHLFFGIPADFKSVGAVVLEFGSVVISFTKRWRCFPDLAFTSNKLCLVCWRIFGCIAESRISRERVVWVGTIEYFVLSSLKIYLILKFVSKSL